MTTVTTTPQAQTLPVERRIEIPLVDWGSLALRAGRIAPVLPHMAWVLRFRDAIDEPTLAAEARRMAAAPYGLGRRIAPPRVPGGRHRWRQESRAPAVAFAPRALTGPDALSAWLDRELGVPLDPEHDAGWRIAAAPESGGGTVVLVIAHHLFGTGGGLLNALYGDSHVDPTVGTTEARFSAANHFTLRREARGVAERVGLGLLGAARLARTLPQAASERKRGRGAAAAAPPPLRAPRGLDRTRQPPSSLRVAAVATLEAAAWDEAAARRDGTGNTLLAAVAANLLRRARIARGGQRDRTMRLLLPVDLTDRDVERVAQRSSGPAPAMTTAEVVVEGDAPAYGELGTLRARMKAAFTADSGSVPTVRGAGDVMRLLPEPLTFRAAARAALRFDGCASNVGRVPAGMSLLGPHEADDMAMLGFPIGNEALACLIRYRDQVGVSVVTDPLRLGPAANLRAWLSEELSAWGLPEGVW
jgi:hypothetical protein